MDVEEYQKGDQTALLRKKWKLLLAIKEFIWWRITLLLTKLSRELILSAEKNLAL